MKQETWDFCLDQMLEDACQAFRETEESRLLVEKLTKMNRDCDSMLKEDERLFVGECFELLSDVNGRRECFLYRQGMTDGVCLLHQLRT